MVIDDAGVVAKRQKSHMTTRIGIDARTAFTTELRGIGKSLVQLYKHMIATKPEWEFYLYYEPHAKLCNHFSGLPNVTLKPLRMIGSRWNLWENIRLPIEAVLDGIDLLHCPAQTTPYFTPKHTVVTIHDVIPLRFDDEWSVKEIKILERNIRRSLLGHNTVITISNYSKNDIIDLFPGANKDEIEVVGWGANDEYLRIDDINKLDAIRDKYLKVKRGSKFFLAVGGGSPRKNIFPLLEAFKQFKALSNDGWHMLIVGLDDNSLVRVKQCVQAWPLSEYIHFYGYIPDSEMNILFCAATAYVFPSLYEGFGLPLLDAMKCGCPILCSNSTSLPEVAESAAMYFNPEDTDSIAQCMDMFASNDSYVAELVKRGNERIIEYSWEKTARKTLEIFLKTIDKY